MNSLLDDIAAVVRAANQERQDSFRWDDHPLEAEALTDPQAFLPLIAATACRTCEHLGIPMPQLVLLPDEDASFGWRLADLKVNAQFGIAAYLLTLRITVIEAEAELSLQRHDLELYLQGLLDTHPAAHGREIE